MDAATRTRLQEGMRRLAAGDRSAFEPVFALLWPALRTFVAWRWPSEAEDVAQEALLKVFSRCAEFDPQRDALAWAIGVAAYEVRTARRRVHRRREDPPADPDSAAVESHERALIDLEIERAALEVVGSLGSADAETLRCLLSGRRPAIPGALSGSASSARFDVSGSLGAADMASTDSDLLRRARRRYELGRWMLVGRQAWRVAPIVLVGLVLHEAPALVLGAAAAFLVCIAVRLWRGEGWARGVAAGWWLGLLPLLLPAAVPMRSMCTVGGHCFPWCVVAGGAAGLIAGAGVGWGAANERSHRASFLISAALVAGVTGGCGCCIAGALGVVAMLLGGFAGSMPVFAVRRLRSA